MDTQGFQAILHEQISQKIHNNYHHHHLSDNHTPIQQNKHNICQLIETKAKDVLVDISECENQGIVKRASKTIMYPASRICKKSAHQRINKEKVNKFTTKREYLLSSTKSKNQDKSNSIEESQRSIAPKYESQYNHKPANQNYERQTFHLDSLEQQPWDFSPFNPDEQLASFKNTNNYFYRNVLIRSHLNRCQSKKGNRENQRFLKPIKNFKPKLQNISRKVQKISESNCSNKGQASIAEDNHISSKQTIKSKDNSLQTINFNRSVSNFHKNYKNRSKQYRGPENRQTLVPQKVSLQKQGHQTNKKYEGHHESNGKAVMFRQKKFQKEKENDSFGVKDRSNFAQTITKSEGKKINSKLFKNFYSMTKQAEEKEQEEGVDYMQFWIKHRFQQGCIGELMKKLQQSKHKQKQNEGYMMGVTVKGVTQSKQVIIPQKRHNQNYPPKLI